MRKINGGIRVVACAAILLACLGGVDASAGVTLPRFSTTTVAPAMTFGEPSILADLPPGSRSPYLYADAPEPSSTMLWTSSDGGAHWTRGTPTLGGGGDSDVATDAAGRLYVSDLTAKNGQSTAPVSVSLNHGRSFAYSSEVQTGGDSLDRQWLAAWGKGNVVETAFDDTKSVEEAWVSSNGARKFAGPVTATHHDAVWLPGPLTYVSATHTLAFAYPADDAGVIAEYVAVSTDGGRHWSDQRVGAYAAGHGPSGFPVVRGDSRGDLFTVWVDSVAAYVPRNPKFNVFGSPENSFTGVVMTSECSLACHGRWGLAAQLSDSAHTALFPALAAAGPGEVDVTWYQARTVGPLPDGGGDLGTPATQWDVMFAQSPELAGGHRWSVTTAVSGFHTGSICTSGSVCPHLTNLPGPFDRRLLDFFGLTIDPRSGLAAISYPRDRPNATAEDVVNGSVDIAVARQKSGPRATVPRAGRRA